MIVNVIHRPLAGRNHLFRWQQDVAHGLGLKVTILVQPDHLADPAIMTEVLADAEEFGDEIGLWFSELTPESLLPDVEGREPFLWLFSSHEKRAIIASAIRTFTDLTGSAPTSLGSYHLDRDSLAWAKELCPGLQTVVAGCFEEGVKVFHGCNHSWYLFNEGMPWGPWYPSTTNSLVPAAGPDDDAGVVAVPHLSRDLALSYESRNDYFATHPANVQRAMANEGVDVPYLMNLTELTALQEQWNDGFAYMNMFVGPAWLSNHHALEDADDVTQALYRDYLGHLVDLRREGRVRDMHLTEFGQWYRAEVPVGEPSTYLAKEILYGSGKHYLWVLGADLRATIDCFQGGSIGDLRPFVARQERWTGSDSPFLAMGSNPYVIHTQYRSGTAHHFADGSRTTLLLQHRDQTRDLADVATRVRAVERDGAQVTVDLEPVTVTFDDGLAATLRTTYRFGGDGRIGVTRHLEELSDPDADLLAVEYVKGCHGTTEYPEDMRGASLSVAGDTDERLSFAYRSRVLTTTGATSVRVDLPPIGTAVALEPEAPAHVGRATEGYLFNPYFTLECGGTLRRGEAMTTWLVLSAL